MKKIKKSLLNIFVLSLFLFVFSYRTLGYLFGSLNGEFLYLIKKVFREKISSNIVVVEIDDLTYNKLGFPIDRSDYIPFLNNLKKASPAVIGFDILFMDKGKDTKKDELLAKKFKELGNVIIGFDVKNFTQVVMPYETFFNSVKNVGYFRPTINQSNNKVYSLKPYADLVFNGKRNYFESFSFAILREYYNYLFLKNDYNILGDYNTDLYNFFEKKIPIRNGEFYINYIDGENFKRESFYNIYTGKFDKELFKDKIVLVGYTAEGVKDDFYVPGVGNGIPIKGVYIHANTINNVLNDTYIIYFNKTIELLIGFLFIFFIIYLNIFYLENARLKWISVGALALFLFIAALYGIIFIFVYQSNGIFLIPNYPIEFTLVLFLSFFASSVLKYINEDKNKTLLSKALSEYVSSDIAREILTSRGEVNLSGENKKITMFFSDIAGFTTISEKLSPEELVSFLRVYLGEMSHIVMDNKGFINKYEGDAIMALWGVFGIVENYGVIEACNSCLLQQAKLKELNEIWKSKGKDELSVRMGLHVGNAIIGNIGAEGRKMEFTALGDSVNLASRLEGVNKFYGTYICVSEDIYNISKNIFIFRYLDKIRVKGKNVGINIYELICRIGEIGIYKENIIKDFEKAVKLYLNRDFEKALEIFEKLEELGDKPSITYKTRCKKYIKSPPDENWDGIWTMDEK